MFYSNDQNAIRSQYFLSWQKHLTGQPVSPLDQQIIDVVAMHPEYHALFAVKTIDVFLASAAEASAAFMHLGLHLAVRDQLAVDKPVGILAVYQRLLKTHTDAHATLHLLMEQLEMHLWQMMHAKAPVDERQYLAQCQKIR